MLGLKLGLSCVPQAGGGGGGGETLEVINEAGNTEITEADYPTLTAVTTFIDFSGCDNLATASFPVLETVGGDIFFDRGALQTIDFSSLISVGGYLRLAGSEGLTVVSFPALTTVAFDINFDFTFSLTEASFPSLLSLGGDFTFNGGGLNQASVDAMLVKLASLDGTAGTTSYDNHSVFLNGGTNAIPSATGLAAKTTLEGRGNSVSINE